MSERKYYVYVVFDMDGVPRYVGKGSGNRANDRNRADNPRLARLMKFGNPPTVKVRDGLTEREAFECEAAIVAAIGRSPDEGPLFNLAPGGAGGGALLPRHQERAAEARNSRSRWDEARRLARPGTAGPGEVEMAAQLAVMRQWDRRVFVERLVSIADRASREHGMRVRISAIKLGFDPAHYV